MTTLTVIGEIRM